MKISCSSSLKHTALAVALAASFTVAAEAAILFSEDWSAYTLNSNPASGTAWTQPTGRNDQFAVVADPGSYSGRFLTPSLYGESGGLVVLPSLQTVETFTLDSTGLSVAFQVALVPSNDGYFRIGLRSSTNSQMAYWVQFSRTTAEVWKQSGNASTLASIGTAFQYEAGYTPVNSLVNAEFELSEIPSGHHLSLTLNGREVIAGDLTGTGTPSFSDLSLFIATRSPRQGYFGNITVAPIPEPATSVLLLSAGAAAWAMRRRKGAQR